MAIKAALLDGRGVYLRMDEVASKADLTERHVPTITVCDLPPGRYLWIPDARTRADGSPLNEYGGAFWELAWLKRVATTRDTVKSLNLPQPRNEEHGVLVDYLNKRGL